MKRRLHLVIDARCFRPQRSGVGNSVYRQLLGIERLLADGKARRWRVSVIRYAPGMRDAEFRTRWEVFQHLHMIESSADTEAHPRGDIWQQFTLPKLLRRMRADVLYSPAYIAPLHSSGTSRLLMVHDDLVWTQPDSYPFAFRHYLRTMTFLSALMAHRVVYPSRDARKRCASVLALPSSKTSVVKHGVDPLVFQRAPLQDREPIVLCIASEERRKNHEVLVKALREDKNIRLRFVGFSSKATKRILELERVAGGRNFEIAPPLDELEIAEEIKQAAMLVLPSHGEGFGIPVIEAMAVGTPLILSDIPVLREVAGRSAQYIDPDDVEGWRSAILDTLEQGPKVRERVRRGLYRLERYTLRRSAAHLLKEAEVAWRASR